MQVIQIGSDQAKAFAADCFDTIMAEIAHSEQEVGQAESPDAVDQAA